MHQKDDMIPVSYCEFAPQILDTTVYNLSTEETLAEGSFDTILPFTLMSPKWCFLHSDIPTKLLKKTFNRTTGARCPAHCIVWDMSIFFMCDD